MKLWFKRPGRLIFVLALFYILLLLLPYAAHKEVSPAQKERFKNTKYYSDTVGTERAAYINDNTDALVFRLKMIEEAKEELILSTFDFHSDESGKDVLAAVLNAADRGVNVRILADGFSGLLDFKGNPWFKAAASHENVSIKIYNPINLLKTWKIQARLHDKYVIADRSMYLLGGRNTRNLFLGDYSRAKNIDRELFIYETAENPDSSLNQLYAYFEAVWALSDSRAYSPGPKTARRTKCLLSLAERYTSLKALYPEAYEDWDFTERTFSTNRVSLLSNPIEAKNKEPWMWESIRNLMGGGHSILIYTPYIICGREMYEGLAEISKQAGQVDILTNAVFSGANPWGCTDYLNEKDNILKTGVTVYEYLGNHSSHTKAYLIDDRMSILGSYNLDMRSTYQDTELMLAVDSVELNQTIRQEAETDKAYSLAASAGKDDVPGIHYVPQKLSPAKQIFYSVLRVLLPPFRRFL